MAPVLTAGGLTPAEPDRWSRWLLERRGGRLDRLPAIRDRVLALAEPLEGATLLDVGTGDGLIGLAALERVGPAGRVVFSDVSPALLEHTRGLAHGPRASFVVTRAEDLAGIADASVDVVTTRSVLIYVDDKAAAFRAMRRVLRPGGRIALFEPINRLMFPEPPGRFWGYDVSAAADLVARLATAYAREARPAMTGFDDRDLARLAENAGFARVHVECHIDVEPGAALHEAELEALLDVAPNPNAPTVREALDATFDAAERDRFVAALGAAMADGHAVRRHAVAYVAARLD